ncbi:EAL domain-containing protein [Aureimonas mangrovi]|uniref:EAL domain-containing protein n=1 Tax=Aureimonas mangrovi TaxID=2758041 RepID=UPI001FE7F472|nr:EAL domain-containing protein [Aureimonas mangrovi]
MAFQPIVDLTTQNVFAYEALVRGVDGQGAGEVLSSVTAGNRYRFDQLCRVKAIELAGRHMPGSTARLSINFLPNAVYEPRACIRASLNAAHDVGFDPTRLMFEFTENEQVMDTAHLENIVRSYNRMGFTTALDDFGAGFAGLSLLSKFQTDVIKIDMEITRDIDTSRAKQAIVKGILDIAGALSIKVIAEGIETSDEVRTLQAAGVNLFQGYYFAKPERETFRTAFPMMR